MCTLGGGAAMFATDSNQQRNYILI